MSLIISSTEAARLTAPHVARAWLLEMDLPGGMLRLHSGVGTVTALGHDWLGVADPAVAGRAVAVSQVQEARFGQAATVTLTLGAVTQDFLLSLRETDIEGRDASVYFAVFDPETCRIVAGPVALFPRGRMTAPTRERRGIGGRTVSVTIENLWSNLNFAPGGRWNDADQRRRFAGDKGLIFVGQDMTEQWQ